MACLEEQNRHLLSKLKVLEEARFNFTSSISNDEKVIALIQERKFLEQRLEEAHIQLSDIKSNWSAQNLALETQVRCFFFWYFKTWNAFSFDDLLPKTSLLIKIFIEHKTKIFPSGKSIVATSGGRSNRKTKSHKFTGCAYRKN